MERRRPIIHEMAGNEENDIIIEYDSIFKKVDLIKSDTEANESDEETCSAQMAKRPNIDRSESGRYDKRIEEHKKDSISEGRLATKLQRSSNKNISKAIATIIPIRTNTSTQKNSCKQNKEIKTVRKSTVTHDYTYENNKKPILRDKTNAKKSTTKRQVNIEDTETVINLSTS